MKDRTILEVFEEERASLVTPQGPFEGFHDGVPLLRHWSERQWRARRCRRPASSASSATVTRVSAKAVGRPVQLRAHATKIMILQDGEVVGEHAVRHGPRTDGGTMAHLRSRSDGSQTPGTTSRCSAASPAPCATARPSRRWRWRWRRRWPRSRRGWPAHRAANGRWSPCSSPRTRTASRPSSGPARRRSRRVCAAPTPSSTSSPARAGRPTPSP